MMRRRVVPSLAVAIVVLLAASAGLALWARSQLRASLPQLDGTHTLAGLAADVVITRDALGIPTVRGRSREDVARATGFLHAQDRFFQMDLARRRAAGELAALVGARAVEVDLAIRIHRFRAIAQEAVTLMTPVDRSLLDAYAAGVNSGLESLDAAPFEYLLLREAPEPWRPEDTLLVVLSMFITLQDEDGEYESTLAAMHDVLPAELIAFLVPPGSDWDAPVVGERFAVPPVPGPDVYDLRTRRSGKPPFELPQRPQELIQHRGPHTEPSNAVASLAVDSWGSGTDRAEAIGSNNWVVSGRLTPDGRPLLANDMHLTVRVPVTWYRATLEWTDGASQEEWQQVSGVTLPGVPAVVVGSNRHVAWGFTNTYADWGDIVLLETDRSSPRRYRTPGGWLEFDRHEEVIRVAGGDDTRSAVEWTIWGPVMPPDYRGRTRAYRWVAHSPERLAASITGLERARTVAEAFDAASRIGAPGQNIVAADRDGHIGWSVFGSIPRRTGLDGVLPTSWADGTRGWNGFLEPSEYPRVLDPPGGRIWTANARVVNGEMLAVLGDGSYEIGSRATIIRDRLLAKERFTREDMLDIQLDTQARFLERWRALLLRTLTDDATRAKAERARLKDVIERDWSGHASAESAAYRLTRAFREQVTQRVLGFVLAECYEADPDFDFTALRRRETPVWALVTGRPMHLLDPQFGTWDDLLLDAIDEVLEEAGRDPADRAWFEFNATEYRHPLSAGLPIVGRWLDMPRHRLSGDLYTPRMHWGAAAASQRMIVSPGQEAAGIMQMPTGQSGHPLSPFYSNSHEMWVKGEPAPFYPGPAAHSLTLTP